MPRSVLESLAQACLGLFVPGQLSAWIDLEFHRVADTLPPVRVRAEGSGRIRERKRGDPVQGACSAIGRCAERLGRRQRGISAASRTIARTRLGLLGDRPRLQEVLASLEDVVRRAEALASTAAAHSPSHEEAA